MPKITRKRFVDLFAVASGDVGLLMTTWRASRQSEAERVPGELRHPRSKFEWQDAKALPRGGLAYLPLTKTRQRARKALGQVADGQGSPATRNAARGAMTVAALCDDYLKAAEKGSCAGQAQTSQSRNDTGH